MHIRRFVCALAIGVALTAGADAQPATPGGVKTLAPADAIKPTGTWSLGARAGDHVFVAGMRGIEPKTNTLVADR